MLLVTDEDSLQEQTTLWAASIISRLWGLHAHEGFRGVLVLAPCKSVHTFGMKRPIDVALLSPEGLVLRSFVCVPQNRVVRHKKASVVIERFSSNKPWYMPGEKIELKNPN